VTMRYNNKLIRESIESRVAENRPLIDIRRHPELGRSGVSFHLEIKNIGKGNAYNINYSYHYYDFYTNEIILEFRGTVSGEECYSILEPGKVLNSYTEEDKQRFNIAEVEGLPLIWAMERENQIKQMLDSTVILCAVYVEYEDFKGNTFWTGKQFGLMRYAFPFFPDAFYDNGMPKALGPFMERARKRVVKGVHDFVGLKLLERKDLLQTEKLEDTLKKKDLK